MDSDIRIMLISMLQNMEHGMDSAVNKIVLITVYPYIQ